MNGRRNFIRSATGLLIAAPMVVRAANIMPVTRKLSFDDPLDAMIWLLASNGMPVCVPREWVIISKELVPITGELKLTVQEV